MMGSSRANPFAPRVIAVVIVLLGVLVAGVTLTRRDSIPRNLTSLGLFQHQLRPGSLAGWNVVLITLDTTRRDHLGCYGYEQAETPVIDRLAARGARFDHAVTDVPATLPAHCSIMTGLDAPAHGVRTNGHFRLNESVDTLAEILANEGYATTAFVNTFVLNSRFGLAQGFDNYDQYPPEGRPTRGPRRADGVTDAATAWISKHLEADPGQPFFAWVHYFDPHRPYAPPGAFGTRYADAPYDGEIAFTDLHLGRLLGFLDERTLTERTLIVLIADHGEGLGEHLEPEHSRLIYDTTIRVPMIISSPQLHDAPCVIDDVTVGNVDVAPTVLSLLGIDANREMTGVDLTTASIGPDRTLHIETFAPLLYHGWAPLHGLRSIDGKYIEAPTPEYYDLAADPHELVNLLYDDPDAGSDLAIALERLVRELPSAESTLIEAGKLSSHARRMLAALGYVSTTEDIELLPGTRPDPKDIYPIYRDLENKEPGELHAAARLMAVPPDSDRGAYRRALILAETAAERNPRSGVYQSTLGIARYRVGDYEGALRAFDESDELFAARGAEPLVRTHAFRAMTLGSLGRSEDAAAELDRLRERVAEAPPGEREAAESQLAEAEAAVIGGSG